MVKSGNESAVYLIGVPIGNHQDITFRALHVLKNIDLLLCEDTRETRLLLDDFLITKDLISYIGSYDFAVKKSLEVLRAGGSVGIVSDRGMPCISDPGPELIEFFRLMSFKINIIPGVSSVTTAFTLSGLKGGFYFAGFLSKKPSFLAKKIDFLLKFDTNIVFFESSHRIKQTLESLSKIVERKIYLLKELTKTHEEVLIGLPSELIQNEIKGEIVIIIPN